MSRRTDERFGVVSFHDLAPFSQELCQDFLAECKTLGIPSITLLVVPQWHGNENLTHYPKFLQWLRTQVEAGHEVCLHGLTHRAEQISGGLWSQMVGRIYTAKEGEFYRINQEEAEHKLIAGMDLMKQADLPYTGFTAPAWLLSAEARQCLIQFGFTYTTYWNRVDLLLENRSIPAPTLVFSARNAWRRAVSLIWVPFWFRWNESSPVLRLAVHPNDLKYSSIRDTIFKIIRQALQTRTAVTYAQLAQRFSAGKTPAPV